MVSLLLFIIVATVPVVILPLSAMALTFRFVGDASRQRVTAWILNVLVVPITLGTAGAFWLANGWDDFQASSAILLYFIPILPCCASITWLGYDHVRRKIRPDEYDDW